MTRILSAVVLAISGLAIAIDPVHAQGDGDDLEALARWHYLYGSASSTVIKPSDVFCGNCVKGHQCNGWKSRAPTSGCVGKRGGLAREHVEIRGWILSNTDFGYTSPTENEFHFDVLLDHDWLPVAPVTPISALGDVNSVVTPYNVIEHGQRGRNWAAGNSMLNPDGTAWGGAGSVVIHVEMNGWGRARMAYEGPPPTDWFRRFQDLPAMTPVDRMPGVVAWPFDPINPPSFHVRPLQRGDYVRVVGTLWEDTRHPQDPDHPYPGGNAKECWAWGPTPHYGWLEIHPVDFVARIDSTPRTDSVEVIAICQWSRPTWGNQSVQWSQAAVEFDRDLVPPSPRPPGTVVGFEELPDDAFTDWATVKTTDRVKVFTDHIHIHVRLMTGPGGPVQPSPARFKALYRVFWKSPAISPVPR